MVQSLHQSTMISSSFSGEFPHMGGHNAYYAKYQVLLKLNLVEVIDVVKEGEQRTKQMIRISEHMMDSESQNWVCLGGKRVFYYILQARQWYIKDRARLLVEVHNESRRGDGCKQQHRTFLSVIRKKMLLRGYTNTGAKDQKGCGITVLRYIDRVRNVLKINWYCLNSRLSITDLKKHSK